MEQDYFYTHAFCDYDLPISVVSVYIFGVWCTTKEEVFDHGHWKSSILIEYYDNPLSNVSPWLCLYLSSVRILRPLITNRFEASLTRLILDKTCHIHGESLFYQSSLPHQTPIANNMLF